MSVAYQPPPLLPKVRFDWIGESWKYFTDEAGTWIGTTLVFALIFFGVFYGGMFALGFWPMMFGGLLSSLHGVPAPSTSFSLLAQPLYWVWTLVAYLLHAFLMAGMLQMAMSQVRGKPINVGMLFGGGRVFLPLYAYHLITTFIGVVGTIMCIFPGLVVYAFLLPGYTLVADGIPFGEAFNRSINAMKYDWLTGAGFVLVLGLISVVSAIPCYLGLLATLPMLSIIGALIYRDMIGMPGAAPNRSQFGGPSYYQPAQPGVWPPAPETQIPPTGPSAYPPPASAYPPAGSSNVQSDPPSDYPALGSLDDDQGTSSPEGSV